MLLLDTHTWLWSAEGDVRRIGRRTRRSLGRAEARGEVRVSPVSIFELTTLQAAGRVRLSTPAEQWIREAIEAGDLRIAALTPAMALDAGYIPRDLLPDPLDRLLVATARQLGATLLTADSRILDYAQETANVKAQNATV